MPTTPKLATEISNKVKKDIALLRSTQRKLSRHRNGGNNIDTNDNVSNGKNNSALAIDSESKPTTIMASNSTSWRRESIYRVVMNRARELGLAGNS